VKITINCKSNNYHQFNRKKDKTWNFGLWETAMASMGKKTQKFPEFDLFANEFERRYNR